MWKALQEGWVPPEVVTEDDYKRIKQDTSDPALHGFVGFGLSFGGKWWGGFTGKVSKNGQDYLKCAKNGLVKKFSNGQLGSVVFSNLDYRDVEIPEMSVIYCDIPYNGTTQYSKKLLGGFDHDSFHEWCKDMTDQGHTIFVSEYERNIPDDATCVWSKESGTTNAAWRGAAKKTTEVVYTFNKENPK
jgi:DNA adenine methylase